MSHDRDILVSALRHLGGYHYDTSPGASRNPSTTDCSRFAFAVLVDVFGEQVREQHKALHLNVDADQPFANVEAIERLGIGQIVGEPLPGQWHYVQGWNGLFGDDPRKLRIVSGSRGHTSLFYCAPIPFAGASLVVQATPTKPPWVDFRSWEAHRQRWKWVRLAVLGST